MDPLSAGASVVTFLGLAFSITKTVHDALSTIRDGPQVIQYLNEEFSQLKSILERLSRISMSATDSAELDRLARKCSDDVANFEMRLRRLDTSAPDGRRGRLWRKLKFCFTEKELEQMRHIVRGHVQLLTVRLNLLQVQQGSFSATQSTEILNILHRLRDDVAALHQVKSIQVTAQDATPPREAELDAAGKSPCTDSVLDSSITRLMLMVKSKPYVVESDDAEELMNDLEHLLLSIQRDAAAAKGSEPTTGQPSTRFPQNHDVSKELKLITRLILSAPSIKLNQSGPRKIFMTMPQGTLIHQERKQKVIDVGDGILAVTSIKRQRKYLASSGDMTSSQTSHGREFTAKLVFKPRSTTTMLTVSVSQGQVVDDTFTSILPQITVNNILPPNSLVFRLAASGSVQELMALVVEGKASLHDHDTFGQSLLHYSVINFPMCKFLIEQGLDVNELAGGCGTPLSVAGFAPGMFQAMLAAGADPTIEVTEEHGSIFRRASRRRDHNANVLLREMFRISPFVRYADEETLGTNPFVDCCEMMFKSRLTVSQAEVHLQKVQFLLDHGYSVNSKWADGTNCLIQFFLSYLTPWRSYEKGEYVQNCKVILKYLVNRGADVYSIDNKGRCVSDFAYNQVFCTPCTKSLVPYLGDVWDSVLDECGYDVWQFRKFHPRKATYTRTYTRKLFEQLWKGREHRCPYWNDAPWPELSPGNIPRTWEIMDESGQVCEQCRYCVESHFEQREYMCGRCGFCTSALDCQCTKEGYRRHKKNCSRSLRQGIGWDENQDRYFYLSSCGLAREDKGL